MSDIHFDRRSFAGYTVEVVTHSGSPIEGASLEEHHRRIDQDRREARDFIPKVAPLIQGLIDHFHSAPHPFRRLLVTHDRTSPTMPEGQWAPVELPRFLTLAPGGYERLRAAQVILHPQSGVSPGLAAAAAFHFVFSLLHGPSSPFRGSFQIVPPEKYRPSKADPLRMTNGGAYELIRILCDFLRCEEHYRILAETPGAAESTLIWDARLFTALVDGKPIPEGLLEDIPQQAPRKDWDPRLELLAHAAHDGQWPFLRERLRRRFDKDRVGPPRSLRSVLGFSE